MDLNEYIWTIFGWKSVKKVQEKKKQNKEAFLVNDTECFSLSPFIFTNQN